MAEITQDQKLQGFMKAVYSYQKAANRWEERSLTGLTDKQLHEALAYELGIAGGCSSPGGLSISYQGSGLRIWISEEIHNTYTMKPTLQGAETMRFAREVFGIKDPSDMQLSLL